MPDISRRALLRSVSVAGAASVGAAAGIGTHAYLTDGGVFRQNALASGSLDLQVATRSEHGGDTATAPTQDGPFPSTFADESTVTVAFPDIDTSGGPASGTATVAVRACDNPGRVWLRADGEASALADDIEVTVSQAASCGGDAQTVFEGPLSGFFDAYGDGAQLFASGPRLGKIELEDGVLRVESDDGTGDALAVDDVPGMLTLDGPNGPVDVEITGLHWKDEDDDPEVAGVDLACDDVDLFRVDVKGGSKHGGVRSYSTGCASEATGLFAPENNGGQPSGLSHFVVYACADDPCVDCNASCLVIDWTLQKPRDHADESLSFDLDLHATQCRHTEATNPWQ